MLDRQKYTVEPSATGPSCLEVETAIAKLKKYKSKGSDRILTELNQAGGKSSVSVIHKLINSIWNKADGGDTFLRNVSSYKNHMA
jgi:hypothetical protein